jgi:hypothetical protein
MKHLNGKVKTTAPLIKRDGGKFMMVPMPQYDFNLNNSNAINGEDRLWRAMKAGKYIPEGYEVFGIRPYYSQEAGARGRATQAANGHPELVKARARSRAINAANGHQNLVAARATQAANGWRDQKKNFARGLATQAANGWRHQKKNFAKAQATHAANGYQNLVKGRVTALHIRWHVNREISRPDVCELCRKDTAQLRRAA